MLHITPLGSGWTALLAMALCSGACIHQHQRTPEAAAEPPPTVIPPTPADAHVEIHDIVGMSQEQATQFIAPVKQPIASCRPTKPGVVQVQVVSNARGTLMSVVGETALDAATRNCVLSALSLYDEELLDQDILEPSTAPSDDPLDQPPAVSSVLTIRW